ncbi:hydroxyacid dehydrogenase [Bacillus sp. V3-13]|uniref:D-2-hydroxyacid dehydrogenase n=1 Tax=Bacillus sp. V3-13 TaxID=2053728 RepID=UPI000C75A99E|nr:D-2-hydroxyacid dehydrogenase [Bacillus sp. V3-13]PLR75802.1 hydroxyacid dehydrogenase [Bacillus sp. V3-13]
MQKRKMIIVHNIDNQYREEIMKLVPDWEVLIGKDSSVWRDHLNEVEVIVGWKKELTEHVLHESTKLRWLQTWSAGVNSLPLKKLESRNVVVTSANGVHAFPISETIFALMLGLTRKIHTYVRNQLTKTWHHSGLSLEMHEKTVGIIGVGAIGKETAKIARAFGMKVLGVRHSGKDDDYVDEMYTPHELNSVLPSCDYVVVTLPLTSETHHLFGAEQFKNMKPSAFFINIGRGEIVDEQALVQALQTGEIAGAGLDVFETEPLGTDSPLWEMENVIITPHTSGSTEHYTKRVIEDIFIPNLKSYLKGEKPAINQVDFSKGY